VDPISQAAIGAAAAQSGAKKTPLRTALWVGALGGLLPDSDVLIRSTEDPLLFLDYHRHFTHALVFIPVGGWITAGLGRLLSRGKHTIRSLFLPASLGWATHGLLDSCTSYGTFLLWPFSSVRVAWHNVAIIDPLHTLPLLAGVLLAAKMRNRLWAWTALAWSIGILLFGVVQRERAESVYRSFVATRGHTPDTVEVKPSFGNNILFRGFYAHDGKYWADAVRVPWWGESRVYAGEQAEILDWDKTTTGAEELHVADLKRFAHFSNGYLIHDPKNPDIVADFRYAMLPNTVAPLWGVDFGGAEPGKHLNFHRYSRVSSETRTVFWDQLMGRP
jgi:inner membrane protein